MEDDGEVRNENGINLFYDEFGKDLGDVEGDVFNVIL